SLYISILFAALALFLPHSAHAANVTVTMVGSQFSPRTITVNAGDTVTFVNQDSMAHTATADNGSFDSGTIQPGQQFGATFNQSGTYQYYCKFHGAPGGSGMSGTIIVAQPSNGSTQGPPNPYANPYQTTGYPNYNNGSTVSNGSASSLQ